MIIACPLCSHTDSVAITSRAQVPVHQNLPLSNAHDARNVARGELEMVACTRCGFVYNAAFDASLLSYGASYDNTQHCSALFDSHLDALADTLLKRHGDQPAVFVEVGCGSGHFLHKLIARSELAHRGIGFDPSYRGPAHTMDGRLTFHTRFYDASCSDIAADSVICRHVIEHVADPLALLRAVRQALRNAPHARVYFETPCVEWMLKNQVIWDFFYEHCSLFSACTLAYAFEQTGFQVRAVRHLFEGQYLWLEATPDAPSDRTPNAHALCQLAQDYQQAERREIAHWRETLARYAALGKLALWGAGAKGATLAHLLDPDGELIDCLVDINPQKQGRFIPATAHPILAPHALPERGVTHAVLMNPNYRAEIESLLREQAIPLTLIEGHDA